jgi:hypothetical protein
MKQYLTVTDVKFVGDAVSPPVPDFYRVHLNRLVIWLTSDKERLPAKGTRIMVEWTFADHDTIHSMPVGVIVHWPFKGIRGGVIKAYFRLGKWSLLLPKAKEEPPAVTLDSLKRMVPTEADPDWETFERAVGATTLHSAQR